MKRILGLLLCATAVGCAAPWSNNAAKFGRAITTPLIQVSKNSERDVAESIAIESLISLGYTQDGDQFSSVDGLSYAKLEWDGDEFLAIPLYISKDAEFDSSYRTFNREFLKLTKAKIAKLNLVGDLIVLKEVANIH